LFQVIIGWILIINDFPLGIDHDVFGFSIIGCANYQVGTNGFVVCLRLPENLGVLKTDFAIVRFGPDQHPENVFLPKLIHLHL
jgi:hypothetical protein